jgi:hypothetical protein
VSGDQHPVRFRDRGHAGDGHAWLRGGGRVCDDVGRDPPPEQQMIQEFGVDSVTFDRAVKRERVELERRQRAYRGDRPPLDATAGRAVIVINDGLATDSTCVLRRWRFGLCGRRASSLPCLWPSHEDCWKSSSHPRSDNAASGERPDKQLSTPRDQQRAASRSCPCSTSHRPSLVWPLPERRGPGHRCRRHLLARADRP